MKNFFIILSVLILLQMLKGCISEPTYNNSTTSANQSRYNDMNPADYYKEMKSDNLQYADIAWHAKEITNMGEAVSTSGQELRDSLLISQIQGTYSVATCTSGAKLRVYPRTSTYPIITNINGGFE